MGNKGIKKTAGYVLVDALLTLFLAGLAFVASLGVLGVITRTAAKAGAETLQQIEERNRRAEAREIIFVQE